jgi:hypothetical protein
MPGSSGVTHPQGLRKLRGGSVSSRSATMEARSAGGSLHLSEVSIVRSAKISSTAASAAAENEVSRGTSGWQHYHL